MLSIENPPRDPPCPCEISQLKGGSDERASDKLEAVDLLNSGLDDNNYPLPKFSIRDYVFSTRSKDIKNNWPFSQENLQLCLKHGVTEVLPPFQPLDAVRNPSQEKCNATSILPDKENTSNLDGKPYRPSDEYVFVNSNAGCDRKLALDSSNINPSGSEGEKDFPSTTTSQSCSDIDSVPTNKSPSLELEANTFLEPLVAKSEAVIPPKSNKAESSNQPAVKKCKLIVKLSNLAHTSTKEDTAMNNFMVSEAMASKVCPVCKTFSSSSNTTLNAHIDQCLSGESTTKWAPDSRAIKHRIKPRKMRSMVDIYATAPHCTLEELDRRNGTNWASNSSMPVQEIEICADQNKQGSSPLNSDESPNERAVYIDANGTKLRILSKFNDPSLDSKILDDPRPKKFVKGDKGGKYLLAKKKKKRNQAQKQHKLSKHAAHGKKICTSHPVHTSEADISQDRNFSCEKNYTKEDYIPQQLKALDQVKFSKPEMIRGWVCSKRTGLTKKTNGRDDHLHSGGCVDREIQTENNQSSLCTNVKRSSIVKIRNEKSPSPTNSKRIDNSSHEPHSEYREHPSPRKRLGFSAIESQICRDRKRSLVLQEFPEHSSKHLREDGPLNRGNHSSSVSKRRIETKAGTIRNADHSIINPKMSSSQQAPLSKSKRFSFLKKHVLSAGRASASDSKFYSKRKCSAVKKSRMQCLSETNQKAVVSRPGVDQHFMQNPSKDQASIEGTSPEESTERTRVLKITSEGEHIISRKEEVLALKNSRSTPITHHDDAGENGGSLMLSGAFACSSDAVESAGKSERACRRDINIELPSEETVGGTFMGFSKTLDPRFDGLEDPSDTQCETQRFVEAYKGPLFESEAPTSSAEPILSGEQELFCTDGAAENMIGENVCGMVELDSSDGQGNYFGEVDSIPIPGPPGSFLPSPGRMDSEDLHGNSSLSSSKIQSSDDHQELIDPSSESPVSTTSTISNSTLGRSDVKSSEKFSAEPPLLDKMRSDFTAVATNVVDPVVENLTPVAKASDAEAGKHGLDELKANITVPEKGPFRFKNDQPCCCSRKESLSQNVALNYQESALLRRRTMASGIMPANGKQMNGDFNRRLDNVRSVNEGSLVTKEAEAASRSSVGHISSRVSADSEAKFSIRRNCESASPPTPNPVLRLMGKNLMVVNKDENVSPQLRTSQSSTTNVHANSQAVPIPMVSTGSSQNEEHHIVHQVVSQGPFFFDQAETKGFMQHDIRWSNGFGNHGISVRPQMSPLASPAMLSSRSTARGFTGSLMHHEYTGGYRSPTQLLQPMNRPGIPMAYDMEKVAESPSLRWRGAEPPANTIKEIIIIDDAPDNEVDSTTVSTHSQRKREGVESSASISVPRPSACDSWAVNPYYITQPCESVTYTGSPVDASFRLPPAKGANANPVRWNCTPEISSAVHPSSLSAASSSTAHLRSELHNSSGF